MIPIKLGISSKISILVCSIAVLSVVLTSGWAFYSFRQLLIEENLENIEHDAHVASDRLRSRIEDMSNDVKFLHDIPPISGLIRASTNSDGIDIEDTSSEVQWKNRLAVIFKELINAKPYYRRIRFIGVADKGREIVRVDRVVPENRIVRIPDDQLQTKEHRDFYQAIIKTADKQVYLSEMNLNWDHGKIIVPHVPVIRAAMRVEDEQGKIFGFVLINMDLSYVFKELKESLHSQTKFLMTNTNGDFLVHPDPLKTFGFDLGRPSLILEEYPTLKGQFNDVGLEHWSGMIEQDSAKSPTMAASMHKIYFDPTKPDRFICLLLTIPKDKIVASLEAVQRQILYVMIGLFLIAMVIGLFFSRSLTRPLLQIIESIDSYGKGDTHSIHVHKAPSDETGILLHAFQHMVFQVEKRANELRFSEARNRAVLDAAADAILSINENGIIQSVNEATETLFGYTSDEMIGQQIEKLMPSPHREMHQSYLERHRNPEMNHPAPSEGVIGRIREISGLRKNGSVFPMELSVSRVWINQSQLFTGIIRDVSERKEAEARLIAKNIELEQKNKEAEQFIYSVSHDLKAPILSCTGLMALLWEDMDRNDLDAVRDSLKRIDRNVLRLENCVGDLLEFCRVGSIPHEPVLVDVNKILKQVVTELELSINQADATLDIEQDMPSVIADPNRMTELFINLLNNAITYGC
ncbi:MAG TPA: hypothetical protein DCM28_19750, partial [Phycisphaerales bacterium]|nr:hypothetical protein [Phycisphaerales bacterium]